VWSIGGGGVRYGDIVLYFATRGYGPRSYARLNYTCGDAARDLAVPFPRKIPPDA